MTKTECVVCKLSPCRVVCKTCAESSRRDCRPLSVILESCRTHLGAFTKMPPKFGGGEKCGICQKTVYAQERIEAGNIPFHKNCFKCSVESCRMQLKRENYAQDKGILFCKKHFASEVTAKNTQCDSTF